MNIDNSVFTADDARLIYSGKVTPNLNRVINDIKNSAKNRQQILLCYEIEPSTRESLRLRGFEVKEMLNGGWMIKWGIQQNL